MHRCKLYFVVLFCASYVIYNYSFICSEQIFQRALNSQRSSDYFSLNQFKTSQVLLFFCYSSVSHGQRKTALVVPDECGLF